MFMFRRAFFTIGVVNKLLEDGGRERFLAEPCINFIAPVVCDFSGAFSATGCCTRATVEIEAFATEDLIFECFEVETRVAGL